MKINDADSIPEGIKARHRYEAELFTIVANSYMDKYNVRFQHSGSTIERVLSEGTDDLGRDYQDVLYHREDGYYVKNDYSASHFILVKRFIKHIRKELSIPMDELKMGRCYFI